MSTLLKYAEFLQSSFFFRVALVINGLGSCAIAIAYPYFLLGNKVGSELVFGSQAAIFTASAVGSYLWAHILDNSADIWNLKLKIVLLELIISILISLSFNYQNFYWLKCTLIIILQFLFAFEIPWSRIAFKELTENSNKDSNKISHDITMAASVISVFAPVLATFSYSFENLRFLTQLNILFFIPYLLIALSFYSSGKKIKFLRIENSSLITTKDFIAIISRNISPEF